ncbi:PREDICTED: calponin homology domain-containing protein DDB_G0272472-like [Wasmannia auropunctata]|uniref:calponin homology domain-containing protein DDB_G0272472-like n=1 Tax=Wasmannia auropunctata TaxID=64793 RepID=UPI0005EF9308|nr:PREDICTED: calponin homology domain-containing protein DDB_G0272472-like [Wasmannia auropunctata]
MLPEKTQVPEIKKREQEEKKNEVTVFVNQNDTDTPMYSMPLDTLRAIPLHKQQKWSAMFKQLRRGEIPRMEHHLKIDDFMPGVTSKTSEKAGQSNMENLENKIQENVSLQETARKRNLECERNKSPYLKENISDEEIHSERSSSNTSSPVTCHEHTLPEKKKKISFTICRDSIGDSVDKNTLFMDNSSPNNKKNNTTIRDGATSKCINARDLALGSEVTTSTVASQPPNVKDRTKETKVQNINKSQDIPAERRDRASSSVNQGKSHARRADKEGARERYAVTEISRKCSTLKEQDKQYSSSEWFNNYINHINIDIARIENMEGTSQQRATLRRLKEREKKLVEEIREKSTMVAIIESTEMRIQAMESELAKLADVDEEDIKDALKDEQVRAKKVANALHSLKKASVRNVSGYDSVNLQNKKGEEVCEITTTISLKDLMPRNDTAERAYNISFDIINGRITRAATVMGSGIIKTETITGASRQVITKKDNIRRSKEEQEYVEPIIEHVRSPSPALSSTSTIIRKERQLKRSDKRKRMEKPATKRIKYSPIIFEQQEDQDEEWLPEKEQYKKKRSRWNDTPEKIKTPSQLIQRPKNEKGLYIQRNKENLQAFANMLIPDKGNKKKMVTDKESKNTPGKPTIRDISIILDSPLSRQARARRMYPTAILQPSTKNVPNEKTSAERAEQALEVVRRWMERREAEERRPTAVPEVAAEEEVEEAESPRYELLTPLHMEENVVEE